MTARYYIGTLATRHAEAFTFYNDEVMSYCIGQQEEGGNTGYRHWQFAVGFKRPMRLRQAKSYFVPQVHLERSRSDAVHAYVHKDDTAVPNTRFTYGSLPVRRNNNIDWTDIRRKAELGDFDNIPDDIFIRHRSSLLGIYKDNARPEARMNVVCNAYWGITHSGKTYRAYREASALGDVYWKSSTTKWWDGYRGEKNVIIDEFDGSIGIVHLLRWFDWYPCCVEIKGSQVPLKATNFWITSNKEPGSWYIGKPEVSMEQIQALLRRLTCTEFNERHIVAPTPPNSVAADDDSLIVSLFE